MRAAVLLLNRRRFSRTMPRLSNQRTPTDSGRRSAADSAAAQPCRFIDMSNDPIAAAVAIRRTFAIISHPDAGKTTITEKLLLFGNLIQIAGTVKGKKSDRHATSDWMAMEQERGISVTSSVMQ